MTKGFFITGSGTGVGKTFVSALLLRAFAKLGYGATYMKPVETGCKQVSSSNDVAIGDDTALALKFATCKTDEYLHSPYRFVPACSPHLAARLAGHEIEINKIVNAYNDLTKNTNADIALVEGAGGVYVPINETEFMTDMIRALDLPVILVTTPNLGTLNHTFLSMTALENAGIKIAGVIINNVNNISRDFIYDDNVAMISKKVLCCDVGFNADVDESLVGFCKCLMS